MGIWGNVLIRHILLVIHMSYYIIIKICVIICNKKVLICGVSLPWVVAHLLWAVGNLFGCNSKFNEHWVRKLLHLLGLPSYLSGWGRWISELCTAGMGGTGGAWGWDSASHCVFERDWRCCRISVIAWLSFDTTTSCCARTCSCHSMVAALLETAARMRSAFDKGWVSSAGLVSMVQCYCYDTDGDWTRVCGVYILGTFCCSGVGQAQLQRK